VAPCEIIHVKDKHTKHLTSPYQSHILPHSESEHGMFGMVTALVVKPATV
jgi:hypothetical protein